MTTAVLYDVHGNLPALEAVLADARHAGVTRLVLGGDYALFGPFPAETVAALRELPEATWIRGNVDRWCAHPEQAPDDPLFEGAIPACREALGDAVVAELDALPEGAVIGETRFAHASLLSDVRSFMPAASDEDVELLAGADEPRVVFGHTHIQFRREGPGGVELINPGSVGAPWDGDQRAAYALVLDDGTVELRRVDYDREAAVATLHERFGDSAWVERLAERLRRAQFL